MKDYYQKSMRALQACRSLAQIPPSGADMSERTQERYTRSVRMIVDFYGKTPDKITESELESYLFHRRNVD